MRIHSAVAAFSEAFGPLTVINLPERVEFAGELPRLGLAFDDPRARLFPELRSETTGGFPSVGARGCFLSHLAVLRAAVETGRGVALVCEDNLDFAPDRPACLAALAGPLAELDWSILLDGHRRPPRSAPAAPKLIRLPPEEETMQSHRYVPPGQALPEFVATFEAMLRHLIGYPVGSQQRPSRCDIEAVWFDLWPGLRDGTQTLCRLRCRAVVWWGRAS